MTIRDGFLMPVWGAVMIAIVALFRNAAGQKGQILDMTYPYDRNSLYWPNAEPFQLTPGSPTG